MTSSEAYAAEIRAWLLGRLERNHSTHVSDGAVADRLPARVQRWWLLEGKQFPLIGGSLARAWPEVLRQVRRLLAVHSPANQIVQVAEGEIDWVASALQRITLGRQEFRVRASRTGLSDDERRTLDEWMAWVGRQWAAYVMDVRAPADLLGTELPVDLHGSDRLTWWAHVASRSRWPLLRHVVVGSLRIFLEDEIELDAIPLPTDPWRLFELVCIVRALAALEPSPQSIRWLDPQTGNLVRAGACTVRMQTVPKHPILDTLEFPLPLRAAIERHHVRTPRFIDVLIEFDHPRGGFNGVLIEAKSGTQSPDSAIPQLRAYRAALRAQGYGRLLVWGIVEQSWTWAPPAPHELLNADDLWVFSDAAHIARVLAAVGICG